MSTIILPFYETVTLNVPGLLASSQNYVVFIPQYPGEIIGYSGSIAVLGTGAGASSDFRLSNNDADYNYQFDYFTTRPTFEVDSATKVLEGGQLRDSPTFLVGDILEGEFNPVATNAERATITLVLRVFKPVTV
jgi:hypothetical protein